MEVITMKNFKKIFTISSIAFTIFTASNPMHSTEGDLNLGGRLSTSPENIERTLEIALNNLFSNNLPAKNEALKLLTFLIESGSEQIRSQILNFIIKHSSGIFHAENTYEKIIILQLLHALVFNNYPPASAHAHLAAFNYLSYSQINDTEALDVAKICAALKLLGTLTIKEYPEKKYQSTAMQAVVKFAGHPDHLILHAVLDLIAVLETKNIQANSRNSLWKLRQAINKQLGLHNQEKEEEEEEPQQHTYSKRPHSDEDELTEHFKRMRFTPQPQTASCSLAGHKRDSSETTLSYKAPKIQRESSRK